MIFAKYKYTNLLVGGAASFNTDAMRGIVEQVIINPVTSSNQYDVSFKDRDGDIVYQRNSEIGRVDDKALLPIGTDSLEKFTVIFANAIINENITIIFKVREIY